MKDSNKLAVLIHGIADEPYMMWKIEKNFYQRGYSVLNFDYESTEMPMDCVITKLESDIDTVIADYDSVYFVVHSLGTFVVRGYLKNNRSDKFQKVVMIAPPNQGSILAERFEKLKIFHWLYGDAGQKLGKGYDDYWRKYPAPGIPFGIIAGGIGTKHGLNPIIPGDDDGIVGVQETKIEGAKDYIVMPGIHSSLLWQQDVIDQVFYFIENDNFNQEL